LFAAFLILNIVDYITGILKAKYFGVENSCEGLKGIIKKLGYWVCIAIGFFLSVGFVEVGGIIGVDLGFTQLFGWFTLATFIINEIRSILENLVLMEVEIPSFIVKGLEVASNKLKGDGDNGSA
jgi:toxin secretion/phage lysis holin